MSEFDTEDGGGYQGNSGGKSDSSVLSQLVDFIGGLFNKVASSGMSDILIYGLPLLFLSMASFGGFGNIVSGVDNVMKGNFTFLELVLVVFKLLAISGFGYALAKTLSKGATSLVQTLANIKGGASSDGAKFFLYLTFFVLIGIVAYGSTKTGEALNLSLSLSATALQSGTMSEIIIGVIKNIGMQTFALIIYAWIMGYVFGTVLKNLDKKDGGLDKQGMVFSIAFSMLLMLTFVVAVPTLLNNWVKAANPSGGIQGGILNDITGNGNASGTLPAVPGTDTTVTPATDTVPVDTTNLFPPIN